MPGPAFAGLFVYAKDLGRLASFYEQVVGMTRVHESPDLVVLEAQGVQLVVHQIPPQIAAGITIATPPVRRENAALKFFFTVRSLDVAHALTGRLGGVMFQERWTSSSFVVQNAMDPEGNVFQVRETTA
jgi:predicted enzyme related to lactoylglutathione lyase